MKKKILLLCALFASVTGTWAAEPTTVPTAYAGTDAVYVLGASSDATNYAFGAYGGETFNIATDLLTIDERTVVHVVNTNNFVVGNKNTTVFEDNTAENEFIFYAASNNGKKKLHLDLYAVADATGYVALDQSGVANKAFALTAGEWKGVEVDLSKMDTEKKVRAIEIHANGAELYIANVYFADDAPEAVQEVIYSNGVVSVTGPLNATNKSVLNDAAYADAIEFDLTGAIVDAATGVITTQSANALILANDADFSTLAGTKNLCKIVSNNWIVFPKNGVDAQTVTFVDNKPLLGGYIYANDNDVVYAYNRTIAADSYATYSFPAAIAVPSNVEVYTFSGYASNTLSFDQATGLTELAAHTPYVLKATAAATIEYSSTGALEFRSNTENDKVTKDGVTFTTNFGSLTTDGNQWVLSGGKVYKANGMKVGSFRAYFTDITLSSDAPALNVVFNENGGTTKIGSIDAEGNINGVGEVYNLAGQRVAQPTKGLYIVNGKKVVLK